MDNSERKREILVHRLRNVCEKLRSTPMPLMDLIPLLQQAADALASSEPPTEGKMDQAVASLIDSVDSVQEPKP